MGANRHDPDPETTAAISALYLDYRDRKDELSDLDGAVVPGEGSHNPLAVLLGEAPGRSENAARRPFVGYTGRKLRYAMEEHGIDPAKCWITNAVKIWPRDPDGKTRTPDKHEIDASRDYLFRELGIIAHGGNRMPGEAAPLLVTLGRSALTAITGDLYRKQTLLRMHGVLIRVELPRHLTGSGTTWDVFPTVHPSALRSTEMRELWDADWSMIGALVQERKKEGRYRRGKHV
jgi:uracil-DNA glycosylase family 4